LTSAGEIVVARHEDVVVGSIRVRHLGAELAETGMLVADPDRRDYHLDLRSKLLASPS
jgi:hypothetical protein